MSGNYLKGNVRYFICKKRHTILSILLVIALCSRAFSQRDDSSISIKIDTLIQHLYAREQFNGAILVARNGKVVYEKAYGRSDFDKNIPFSVSTPCYLASVSKQFTATGILILVDNGLLGLSDPLNKYFPDFPGGGSITITQLLTHTSGIVNYEELGIDNPGLTNLEVYKNLVRHKTLQFQPGEKYDYSNSGYVLLAMIIENVSKMSFSDFMSKYVFEPLEMTHTFICTSPVQRAVSKAYGKFGDESDNIGNTTGDGGICSTVEDLLKWDQALYSSTLVPQFLIKQAFEPVTLHDGSKSFYGFGWMIKNVNNKKIVYHTGGSGGYRTYIERDLDNRNTIIILTNIENSPRREISQAIQNILKNDRYELPKISIATKMYRIRNDQGIDSAIRFYMANKADDHGEYDFSEQELNLLGYKLWSINKIDEAIEIFKLNVVAYPSSSNAYESLGEAYLNKGDKNQAEVNFKESLKLDPTNQDAIRMMKQIEKAR
jgi:CubicO group peptidase (beta-lactamase class C family)